MSNYLIVHSDVLNLIFYKVFNEQYKLNFKEIFGASLRFNNDEYIYKVFGISSDTVFRQTNLDKDKSEITLEIEGIINKEKVVLERLINNLNYYLNSFRIKLLPIYGTKQIVITNESETREK